MQWGGLHWYEGWNASRVRVGVWVLGLVWSKRAATFNVCMSARPVTGSASASHRLFKQRMVHGMAAHNACLGRLLTPLCWLTPLLPPRPALTLCSQAMDDPTGVAGVDVECFCLGWFCHDCLVNSQAA